MRQLAVIVALVGCGSSSDSRQPPAPAVPLDQIVATTDRADADKKIDGSRKPVDTLKFFGVAAGMHVADLGAGGGYTSELLARAVGPSGHVIAQDSPNWDGPGLQKVWALRTSKSVMANTTHVVRQWDDPLPADAHDLDAVYFVCAYHDVIAEKSDPDKLDRAVFAALKHGGVFVVIDNSARDGSGDADVDKLHRIDEKVVRDQVAHAGFELAGTADFLRNSADTRDWNADPGAKDPRARTQDRFVLKFVKR